ncbi:MAG: type I restriction endonuclease subunit R [Candidatus Micrarchaeales archaeon]|nr:type I restriction endonuclease subunit R [Candidatus Micrarchaeales archaeon]
MTQIEGAKMKKGIYESDVEEATLDILKGLGYKTLYGPDIAPSPEGKNPERKEYSDVILIERLREAIKRINPKLPIDAQEEAVKKVLRQESRDLVMNNEAFHKMLIDGLPIQVRHKDGSIRWETVKLIDFEKLENNDWLTVNQFTIIENRKERRPDVIIFVNGIPLVLIELKNPASENATITDAYNQFETYKDEIPSVFRFNAFLVISDGNLAQHGTITSTKEWFLPWKAINGEIAARALPQLQVLLQGIFNKAHFLDLINHYIVFEHGAKETKKKMAAYHQYHAVNKAYEATIKAIGPKGDKRCGVIWHTQGSGKSLIMVFYTGKLVLDKILNNPTIVVLTDRNDLDDQLFGTFSSCEGVLRQKPVEIRHRRELRDKLSVASGGVIFTTIQKFLPEQRGDTAALLSDRKNIVVIADEAHRSQYDFVKGFARHIRDALPNASFIGFTGTPIEKEDKSTTRVFGDIVDTYDIQQSVEDGATVRIYYEPRLAKLELSAEEKPKIDPAFEEITEDEEVERKEKLKSRWARVEALVGSEKRIKLLAKDLVDHFESRVQTLEGKGMIVCMSRRICVDLYNEIVKLHPEWHSDSDSTGFIKVVMTGSASDPRNWQQHIRNKQKREALANRMKDPDDELKLVIVRDMWLTGFDAPSLHTMYVDKPMSGHGLMQAIARVNRVFKDKPGGLVVDYIGIADNLKKALAAYTANDRKIAKIPQEEAVALVQEKHEITKAMFHGFDYSKFFKGTARERLAVLPAAMDHILKQNDGQKRFIKNVSDLSKAFALAVPNEEAVKLRDDVGFFQAVKAGLVKATQSETEESHEAVDTAIRQLISKAVAPAGVIDIYSSLGIKKPDISILSDQFLEEVKDIPYKNLAFELLKKLLADEIRSRSKKNIVQSKTFSEMLERAVRKYQNQNIQTAEVIEELIGLAKDIKKASKRGEELNLSEEELAFYDALEANDSAVKVLGDKTLKKIAQDLAVVIRKNVTVDWTIRESVRAKLRIMVKNLLKKYGYPPDRQEKATKLVLEQAELFGEGISAIQ